MKSSSIIKRTWESLIRWLEPQQLRQHEDKVLLVLTLLIGAIVGLVIVAFILLTENLGARMYPAGGAAWRRIFVPVAGALITGFLLLRYFPNARGSGIPQTKTALFLHSGFIKLSTVLGKFCCSSISLASGIALGREGPSVQVGAGIASVMGRQFGLSAANARALIPIGTAAALAAAFNTPIAAVLFTLEEILGNLHAKVLGAIVISSATSWMVLHLILGDEPLFHVPSYQLVHPIEFAFYAALGIAGGLVSVLFVKLLLILRKYFLRMPAGTAWFQPAVGGLLVGILGWFVPAVLGVGYSHVSDALNSRLAVSTMMLLVILKLVATAACYSSGNAGGIFGPSLFIGAMMGGAFGAGTHFFLPDFTGSIGAYALVGMGVAFAGIIRAPMTSVIMIFEITRDYSIIVPLMIANLISYFVSSRLQKKPIYEALMQQDGIHLPTALRDRESAAFVSKLVRQPERILRCTDRVQDVIADHRFSKATFPVVDANGLCGMVTYRHLQEAVQLRHQDFAIADLLPSLELDSAISPDKLSRLHPDQSLDEALGMMERTGLNVLPVTDRINPAELLGVISLSDIIAEYNVEHSTEAADQTQYDVKAPTAAIRGIIAVLILAIATAVFLSHHYRSQRTLRAMQYAQSADELMQKSRYPEAAEKYRSALSISHNNKDRLSLATALVKAGRWNEAEIYLNDIARDMPNNGQANLELGRIAAQREDFEKAIEFYHRSIYGHWPKPSPVELARIRIELIEFLGKHSRLTQARAELLSLLAECPADLMLKRQVAHLLLNYGFPAESVQIFQEITKIHSQDADAYAGQGQAEFLLGNFQSAQRIFKTALRLNPADVRSKQQIELIDHILMLDPKLRGLITTERYERSRKLLEAILTSLDGCTINQAIPLTVSETEIANIARKLLSSRKKPPSYSDALETNLSLAEQLWKARVSACGQPKASDEILKILMTQLSRY